MIPPVFMRCSHWEKYTDVDAHIFSLLFFSVQSSAETLEIEMLNKLEKEKMVYSVKVAKIDVGDTIIWKSIDKGHNVEFKVGPV